MLTNLYINADDKYGYFTINV